MTRINDIKARLIQIEKKKEELFMSNERPLMPDHMKCPVGDKDCSAHQGHVHQIAGIERAIKIRTYFFIVILGGLLVIALAYINYHQGTADKAIAEFRQTQRDVAVMDEKITEKEMEIKQLHRKMDIVSNRITRHEVLVETLREQNPIDEKAFP